MQDETTSPFDSFESSDGVCVADGYGIRVAVNSRHLVVADGIGRQRRERRFARATAGLKRLVVIGHEGYVTLEAIRWLTDVGIALVQIDRDGKILTVSAVVGSDDPRLRRTQALAAGTPVGVEIARAVLGEKLRGQATVLATMAEDESANAVEDELARLEGAESLSSILQAEAEAAAAYWQAWEGVRVRFPKSALPKLPEHWTRLGRRGSPLTGSPRLAASPANAILNYIYALLEAETRIACLAVGLDPGLGVFHADQRNRDSMALDLMEAVRPSVDAYVLDLLQRRTFSPRDFHETRQGVCRILSPLTHSLCETLPAWRTKVAMVVEGVARILAGQPGSRIDRLATPLTQENRSRGRQATRRGPRRETRSEPKALPPACRSCGVILSDRGRRICDGCLSDHRNDAFDSASKAASNRLRDLRAIGQDPAHGGEAARKRGRSISKRRAEAREWQREHGEGPPKEVFVREILPGLKRVPVRRIAEATGLTRAYCSAVRRGEYVPHARHWDALRRLAD